MSFPDFVNLCSEQIDAKEVRSDHTPNLIQGKPTFVNSNCQQEFEDHAMGQGFEEYGNLYGYPISSPITGHGDLYANGFCSLSSLPCSTPIIRQFWKAGDYEAGVPLGPVSQNGQNRLRVHPKFLHSNATSHKWAFGALAELLDNAIDEVQNGASFVVIDKITNLRDGNPALLIQDDGGGMDPESLRHCMSFGFSNKQSDSSIGQYGNGFKTSTMRLGADVIVFSRCNYGRNITQSVGLLSYTFLRQTGSDDIIVPMVDYEFDPLTGALKPLIRHGEKQFYSNLSTLLRWSPFATEDELLKQFNDMGHHGTKVVVFNLWFNDDGDMELDFDTDADDIMISGAHKIAKTKNTWKMLHQTHIATRFRYSLRVYSSILYLHLPKKFRIILRGRIVEPHHIVNDLKFIECIKYKPQVGGKIEYIVMSTANTSNVHDPIRMDHLYKAPRLSTTPIIITTIGFLEGAPSISIHGFNVYHKNRLILPFWPVVSSSDRKCDGVAGVLEVNFLKPTHNKQDFESSNLYGRLETRLKDMAVEYWNYHCHLVGFPAKKKAVPSPVETFVPHQMLPPGTSNGIQPVMFPFQQLPHSGTHSHTRRITENPSSFTINVSGPEFSTGVSQVPACNDYQSVDRPTVTSLNSPTCLSPGHTNSSDNSQIELARKRRHENHMDESLKKRATAGEIAGGLGSNQKNQLERKGKGYKVQRLITMIREKKKLQTQCLEFEKAEKQLLIKVQKLRDKLLVVQHYHDSLLAGLKLMGEMKMEK